MRAFGDQSTPLLLLLMQKDGKAGHILHIIDNFHFNHRATQYYTFPGALFTENFFDDPLTFKLLRL